MRRLLDEPILFGAAIRACFYAASTFGLSLTTEQTAAVMGALEAILALATRMYVTPNHMAEARAMEKLQQGV